MSRLIHQMTVGRTLAISGSDAFEPLDGIEVTYFIGGTYNSGTDTGTSATIYQAATGASQGPVPEAGASGGPNPFVTGSSGLAETYLEPSPTGYDIRIKDTVGPARITTRVIEGWGFSKDAELPTFSGGGDTGKAAVWNGSGWDKTDVVTQAELTNITEPAAGTAGLRKIGSTALTAMAGNATPTPGDETVTVTKTGKDTNGLANNCFSAYRSAALSIASGGVAIVWDAEDWDNGGVFNLTNGRFTPNIKGWYRLNAAVAAGDGSGASWSVAIFKNGNLLKTLDTLLPLVADRSVGGPLNVQANGTTDYFTVVVTHNSGANIAVVVGATAMSYFQGEFIGRQS